MDVSVLNEGTFTVQLGDTSATVHYLTMKDNEFELRADFSYHGKRFEFIMSRWLEMGWGLFLARFHQAHPGQAAEFGCSFPEFQVDPDQINAVVLASAKDVFAYINVLLRQLATKIVDYSIWYCNTHPEPSTYEEYIQLVACDCVVNSHFIAASSRWTVVPFERCHLFCGHTKARTANPENVPSPPP